MSGFYFLFLQWLFIVIIRSDDKQFNIWINILKKNKKWLARVGGAHALYGSSWGAFQRLKSCFLSVIESVMVFLFFRPAHMVHDNTTYWRQHFFYFYFISPPLWFIGIATNILIFFISNFCSWFFFCKILIYFQFHHSIPIWEMLFFQSGLYFF